MLQSIGRVNWSLILEVMGDNICHSEISRCVNVAMFQTSESVSVMFCFFNFTTGFNVWLGILVSSALSLDILTFTGDLESLMATRE